MPLGSASRHQMRYETSNPDDCQPQRDSKRDTDPAAPSGTTYYYRVSAVNSGGEGPDSLQVSALPVSLSPPQLVSGVSGGQIQISWLADHLGWTLQVQTNDLSAGLGTNWISIPDSATNTQFAAPLAPENPTVFYRLIHQ